MKKRLSILLIFAFISGAAAPNAHASIFGEENATLIQILLNAVKQLEELRQIVQAGEDTLNLIRDINRGINDSIQVAETSGIHIDPRLYGDLQKFQDVTQSLDAIYGPVLDSPLAPVQKNTDETVAEAISMNNNIYDYTDRVDKIGEEVKQYSHKVSPGGAAKLTAESLGVVIHVLNEQLRASATGLKLQAQAMAVQNKKDKDSTNEYLTEATTIENEIATIDPKFEVPRF